MYQKSPFPYLFILLLIVGTSCFTNLTIDKEIEAPIIHILEQKTVSKSPITQQEINTSEEFYQLASVR